MTSLILSFDIRAINWEPDHYDEHKLQVQGKFLCTTTQMPKNSQRVVQP